MAHLILRCGVAEKSSKSACGSSSWSGSRSLKKLITVLGDSRPGGSALCPWASSAACLSHSWKKAFLHLPLNDQHAKWMAEGAVVASVTDLLVSSWFAVNGAFVRFVCMKQREICFSCFSCVLARVLAGAHWRSLSDT